MFGLYFLLFQVKGMVASLWVVADCFGGIIGSPLGSFTYDNWGMGISTGPEFLRNCETFTIFKTGVEAGGLLVSVILLGIYSIWRNCQTKAEQIDQSC